MKNQKNQIWGILQNNRSRLFKTPNTMNDKNKEKMKELF